MSQGTSSGSGDYDSGSDSDSMGVVSGPNDMKSVRLVQLFMTSLQQQEPVPWDGK